MGRIVLAANLSSGGQEQSIARVEIQKYELGWILYYIDANGVCVKDYTAEDLVSAILTVENELSVPDRMLDFEASVLR